MSNIGKNIKKIRSIKKLSQSAFAELFELSRTSVGAYEEGRAEPKVETIIHIASHFGVSLDTLLTKDLTVNELYNFNIFDSKLYATPESQLAENKTSERSFLPYVSVNQNINYVKSFKDDEFVASLPKITLPYDFKGYRAFEMNSSGMEYDSHGIFPKDILIAKPSLISADDLSINSVYVIILNDKITIRRLVYKDSYLSFKGDNSSYQPTSIPYEEISEIWEVKGRLTTRLTAPTLLEDRVHDLENKVSQLFNKINQQDDR